MRINKTVSRTFRFFSLSVVSLLVLMPLWYFSTAPVADVVMRMAGAVMDALFGWAKGVTVEGTFGVLRTNLSVLTPLADGRTTLGELAPKVDYRFYGYGLVLLWALFIGSWPSRLWLKLPLATLLILLTQVFSICIHWLQVVLNQAGPDVFRQAGEPRVLQEFVLFMFHFNLYMLTALAPVLLWLLFDRDFVRRMWVEMTVATAMGGRDARS